MAEYYEKYKGIFDDLNVIGADDDEDDESMETKDDEDTESNSNFDKSAVSL